MDSIFRLPLISTLLAMPALAVVNGPYTPDANTVHLFHLDEAAGPGPAINAVSAGPSLIPFNGSAVANAPNAQPVLTTILGAAGPPGFSNAANIANVTHGLGLDANSSGGFQPGTSTTVIPPDGILHSSLSGTDGSFTLEALVNVPNLTVKREIMSTDSSLNNRCFQFYTSVSYME